MTFLGPHTFPKKVWGPKIQLEPPCHSSSLIYAIMSMDNIEELRTISSSLSQYGELKTKMINYFATPTWMVHDRWEHFDQAEQKATRAAPVSSRFFCVRLFVPLTILYHTAPTN